LFALLALLLVAIVGPVFLKDYFVHILIMILLYAYLGQCWNIVCGYTGQFSLGHAAFFGIGGYVSTYVFVKLGLSPWLSLFLGGAVLATFLGLFMGYLCFRYRLKGFFFALVTLSFSEVLRILAQNFMEGKSAGILIPFQGSAPSSFQFQTKLSYYYIILGLTVFINLIVYKIETSSLGDKFKAIREDEDAAESIGINSMKYKLIALGLSSYLTAVAGTFYAQYILFIDPQIAFGSNIGIQMILPPILGGLGTVFGPLVGAAILTPIAEIPRYVLPTARGVELVIYGIVIIIAIVSMPNGILGVLGQSRKRTSTARKETPETHGLIKS
jgi:branched-chain amino acid transport system permease protein